SKQTFFATFHMLCLCHLSIPFASKTRATALTVRGSHGRERPSDRFLLFTREALLVLAGELSPRIAFLLPAREIHQLTRASSRRTCWRSTCKKANYTSPLQEFPF